jgi:hypothetical protein
MRSTKSTARSRFPRHSDCDVHRSFRQRVAERRRLFPQHLDAHLHIAQRGRHQTIGKRRRPTLRDPENDEDDAHQIPPGLDRRYATIGAMIAAGRPPLSLADGSGAFRVLLTPGASRLGREEDRSGSSRTRTAEKQYVAVHVLQLESTQPIVGVFERLGQLHLSRCEFGGQRVRIGDIDVRVPRAPGSRCGLGSGSMPTALTMIIAPPRWTIPKKTSSAGPWNVISNPRRSR